MRRRSRRIACVIGVASVAAGCAGAARTPAIVAPLAPPAERASVLYAVDATDAGRALLPLPLVRGSVAGKRTLMVVDTGTGAHVLAAWFARSLGLQISKVSEATHDPSGRPVVMERCDEPHLVIDGFDAVADRPTPVIDLPSSFEAAGIGVILSPQVLAGADTTVILDMPRRELRRVRSRELALEVAHDGTFEVEHTSLCGQEGAGFFGRRLTATAIVDGMSTVLEVDTGAIGSPIFLLAETEPGRKVLARPGNIRETGFSAAGTDDVVTAKDIPVRLGSQDWLGNVTVMRGKRDPHCGGVEGRLGLDWLRACVFTIGEREYRLRCEEKQPR
jgi:hypothetical protein